MKKLLLLILLMMVTINSAPVNAKQIPSYSKAIRTFGDYTNYNPAPTSGTLTGVYRTADDWTQTGTITCNRCRLYFGGKVTFNNTINGAAGVEGNVSTPFFSAATNYQVAQSGLGQGGGPGGGAGIKYTYGGNIPPTGGGHGGAGGIDNQGGVFASSGGQTYPLEGFIAGSAGGPVPASAGVSGAGGAGIYVEAIGPIVLTSGAAIHADGGSVTTVGAGASGGTIDMRSLQGITLASGCVLSANGSNGVSFGAGGGGGIINLMPGPGLSTTNNGATATASGGTGAVGANGATSSNINLNATFVGPRVSF